MFGIKILPKLYECRELESGYRYFYLSIKIPVYSRLRFRNCDWVAEDIPDIKYFVIRSQTHEKELVFYDQQTIADKFQKVVR